MSRQFRGRRVPDFHQNAAPLPEPSEEHEPALVGGGEELRNRAVEKGDARRRLAVDQMPCAAAQKIKRLRVLERLARPIRMLALLGAAVDVGTCKEVRLTGVHGVIVSAGSGLLPGAFRSVAPGCSAGSASPGWGSARRRGGPRSRSSSPRARQSARNTAYSNEIEVVETIRA